MKDTRWDAVIVGGGPAGAAAACHLARAGKETLLIEREKHAHHKVCGEFLSFEGRRYLEALGVDPLLLGASSISAMRLFRGQRMVCAHLPFEAQGLSRFTLDEQLLARAAQCGAEIVRGCKVNAIVPAAGRWRVATGAHESYAADTVFLATGKHELPGMKRPPGKQNDFIGFKMHFFCPSRQLRALDGHIDIFLFDGGYAGLQLIENNRANLCLVISKRRFAELGKRWDALGAYLGRSSAILRGFLDEATPCWARPAAITSLPYGYVYARESKPEAAIYRLGDQFAVIPSFTGEGMSIALHTAKLAVDSFLGNDAMALDFHRRAYREINPQIRAARRLGRIIETSPFRDLGFAACRLFPSLMSRMAARTRLRTSRHTRALTCPGGHITAHE